MKRAGFRAAVVPQQGTSTQFSSPRTPTCQPQQMKAGANLFNSDAFLTAVAEAKYPDKKAAIDDVQVGEGVFRLLVVDGRKVIDNFPFSDYYQPVAILDRASDACLRQHPYLRNVVLRETDIREWDRTRNNYPYSASPFVRFSNFANWEAYVQAEQQAAERLGSASSISGFQKREKKLKKDMGSLEFVFDDESDESLKDAIEWKRIQYRETGVLDMLEDPAHVRFFEILRENGLAFVSSLYAGGKRVAVHIAGRDEENRIYSWIPATDPEAKRYSAGTILRNAILEFLFREGYPEFDFTYGDEAYKLSYSTNNRVLGVAGNLPLLHRAMEFARQEARSRLMAHPRAFDTVKRLVIITFPHWLGHG
jgi:CelD/BcsL family acetyltransferase involved in cellulose biosynthesis